MKDSYQICTRCVMDTSDRDIVFNDLGECNHCERFDSMAPNFEVNLESVELRLANIADKIRSSKRGRYDSILGLSGGIDSSYVAYMAGKLNLNPLVVHFDNGWNSEIAISNIEKIVKKLNFDLFTYVINWNEFRDIQRSFFKASVIDIELVSDHAIFASMYYLARKHGIKYVLSGTNFRTEHTMPKSWYWRKQDLKNLKSIHKAHGELRLETFPTLTTLRFQASRKFGFGQKYIEILNEIPYRRGDAMKTLQDEFDWQYYGGKHYESVFTKFYQAYVLPVKFGVDKRRAHYSDLIHNGEMTRQNSLDLLSSPPYNDEDLIRDKEYVLKKLGFSENEFEDIMKLPINPHNKYDTDQWQYDLMMKIKNVFKLN